MLQGAAAPIGVMVAISEKDLVEQDRLTTWSGMIALALYAEGVRRLLTKVGAHLPTLLNHNELRGNFCLFAQSCPLMFAIWRAIAPLKPLRPEWITAIWTGCDALLRYDLWRLVYTVVVIISGVSSLLGLVACSWRKVDVVLDAPMLCQDKTALDAESQRGNPDAQPLFSAESNVAGNGLFAAKAFGFGDVISLVGGNFMTREQIASHPERAKADRYVVSTQRSGKRGELCPLDPDCVDVDPQYIWGFANEPPVLLLSDYPELLARLENIFAERFGSHFAGRLLQRPGAEAHISPNAYLHRPIMYLQKGFVTIDVQEPTEAAAMSLRALRPISPNEEIFFSYWKSKQPYRTSIAGLSTIFYLRQLLVALIGLTGQGGGNVKIRVFKSADGR